MTMTSPPATRDPGRHERIYRRLLVVYPRSFREEYGDDLAQSFRDLLVLSTGDGRGVWWRTARDLISSATRVRCDALLGRRGPSGGVVFVLLVVVLAVFMVGPGPLFPVVIVPVVLLIGLPTYGISRLRRAWVVRRTTGDSVGTHLAVGLASFALAAGVLVLSGGDAGYLVFAAVGLSAIGGSVLGIVWAVVALAAVGRERRSQLRWARPALVLVFCLAVLGVIVGASYNSYRQSLGPPGDHSVENASADTRALWQAANSGDVDEVVRLTTDTCADPWVKFPYGNGRHNAKGQAETRELELPDDLEPPYREIAEILADYMDDWDDRCSPAD